VGAFDTVEGEASCPRCGTVHQCSTQTKFFDPDFGSFFHRLFVVGEPQPLDFTPSRDRFGDAWWRLRPARHDRPLALLADYDDMQPCPCGARLAHLLHFTLTDAPPDAPLINVRPHAPPQRPAGYATLVAIELLDVSAMSDDALFAAIDFAAADGAVDWRGGYAAFTAAAAALERAPLPERVAALRSAFAWRSFPCVDELRHSAGRATARLTSFVARMRCAVCRAERAYGVTWSHHAVAAAPVLFAADWPGGHVTIGNAVPLATAAQQPVELGYLARTREPKQRAELVIMLSPVRCQCASTPEELRCPRLRLTRFLPAVDGAGTGRRLVTALCADPEDAALRAVLADWLEDEGRLDDANRVRHAWTFTSLTLEPLSEASELGAVDLVECPLTDTERRGLKRRELQDQIFACWQR
jgi:uncharacterized protein (TIGR02996 family)